MLVGLVAVAVLVMRQAWIDIATIAWNDQEASHVLLAPLVIAWMLWSGRERLIATPVGYSWVGLIVIGAGWGLGSFGYFNRVQAAWHLGAVLAVLGCMMTVLGPTIFRRFWPCVIVMLIAIPIPGMLRQELAIPLQRASALLTEQAFMLVGLEVVRSGNVLTYNDVPIAVAEACNGMRMVFALGMVAFAFAFAMPLRPYMRGLIIVLSPLLALVCNVARLVPTVWFYGHYPKTIGPQFHDMSGWVMLLVAFFILKGVIALFGWLRLPVHHQPTIEPVDPAKRDRVTGRPPRAVPVALGLLAVIFLVGLTRPTPADAEPYHKAVFATHLQAPMTIGQDPGQWVGKDVPLPPSAIQLLKPNVTISRSFTNTRTHENVSFLVVQCKDARDLQGHYPPICYPASGWSFAAQREYVWPVEDLEFHVAVYDYEFQSPTGMQKITVVNYLLLPEGSIVSDMDHVFELASDYVHRFYGAAQVQLVTNTRMSPERRREVFTQITRAHLPLIRQILAGYESGEPADAPTDSPTDAADNKTAPPPHTQEG